jgi:hypothetical protein
LHARQPSWTIVESDIADLQISSIVDGDGSVAGDFVGRGR